MPNWENKTILVVEDDEASSILFKEILRPYGPSVLIARDGREAIKKIESNTVDIVVMDIRLPFMNGYEATKLIKEIKPEIPVLAQTAYTLFDDRERCITAGCDDYMVKPINSSVLVNKINRFLS